MTGADVPGTLGPSGADALGAAFDSIQIGIAIVDSAQRIVRMNAAFHESLGLPPGAFPPGTPVVEAVRASALRGVYGPGDPDAQVAAVMAPDRTRAGRLRRRTHNGRSFDLHNSPLPDGGYIVSAIETTGLLAARADAERAARETADALATLPIGVGAFAPDGALLFANARFAELLSLPRDGARPGARFADMLDALDGADEYADGAGMAFLAAQRAADRAQPSTVRRIRGDGTLIDVASAPLPDGGWTIAVSDVTAQARAEDDARRRARLLDSVLEAVPHGIAVYGPDRLLAFVNATYAQVMDGATISVGEHMADIVRRRAEAGEYGPGDPAAVASAQMAYDISRPQRRHRRRPDGTALDVATAPLPDGGHVSVVTDVTALVQAETEATRRGREASAMLASIRHGILLWDAERRLVAANSVAAELLGLPRDVLVPGASEADVLTRMRDMGAWADSAATASALLARDRGEPYRREVTMRAGRILDMRAEPMPGGGWVTTYTDVTEERRAAEELRRSRDAAEAANQAKSRFLATMSHELRTPLNAIIGFSDTLAREGETPDPDRVAEFSDAINNAGGQLLSAIDTVLDVARIESGRFGIAADSVDLARLLGQVARQARAQAEAGELDLDLVVPDDLPTLRADERTIARAVHQLLSNALKFTDAGGTVVLGARRDADGVLIYVRDTGIGIEPEAAVRAFEPFVQLDDSRDRRYPGAGLGLYISRAIAAAHGGTLDLRGEAGVGTIAELRLPIERPSV